MIERPVTEVLIDLPVHSGNPVAGGEAERRAGEFARRFRMSLGDGGPALNPNLRVTVTRRSPEHVGLGSGTQMALSIARALSIWADRSSMPAEEMARRMGRCCRSAVGVHGFNCGGFLVEGGKRHPSSISPLVARLNFPSEWHWLLIIPKDTQGLHGAAEREAFDGLAPVSDTVTADLCRLTLLGMLPAVAERDFAGFSESLCEFSRKVGECFAACQGGVYASALAPEILGWFERHGIRGVAQSSWGPTLCAVTESELKAQWLAARITDCVPEAKVQTICTPANNLGAKTEILEAGSSRDER
jgi:beta-RFAP synthase